MTSSRARLLRSRPTDAETLLWSHLRRKQLGGLRFRRQAVLGRFVVDFICYEARLVIEVDGGQHAENAEDMKRQAWIENQDFRVLRF